MPEPALLPDTGAPSPPRRTGRRLAVGCGIVLLLLGGAAAGLFAYVNPYARASHEAARLIEGAMPPGATVAGVRVQFPARLSIDRLDIPADAATGRPPFTLREIDGQTVLTSWLPWFGRQPELTLQTRFWGGTVSLEAVARDQIRPGTGVIPPFVVRGQARDLLLEECVGWLNVAGAWRGRMDLDVAGQVDVARPRASVVDVGMHGRELHVPEIDFSDVVLPPNKRAILHCQATYRDETIEVTQFSLSGTGYNVEGKVRILLREPLEASPLRGTVALQLKEVATWRRTDVDEQVVRMMMQMLIQSKGKLNARLGGTVGAPEAELDQEDIIQSLLGGAG